MSTDSQQLSSAEETVLAALDHARIVADMAELVAIPSVDGSDAEHDAQHWCAARMRELGLDVDHWRIDIDELTADPDFPGAEVERSEGWGCVGLRPADGDGDAAQPALILNGHVDVVPPGDAALWPTGEPFTPRTADGCMWGRGACDMKGGVAAMLGAVEAVRRAGVKLARPLAVHTVIGEEDGGLGTFATLRRGHTGEACVIGEPTCGTVIPANAGALTFRLEVPGRATHGSRRSSGVSAVDKFSLVQQALARLEDQRCGDVDPLLGHLEIAYPLSVGMVRAGDWASTVPDLLIAEGRYGVRLGESVDEAKRAFERAVAQVCQRDPWLADNPVRVSWPGGMFASGRLDADHPLLDTTRDAVVAASGGALKPPVRGASYGSDLRQYTAAGIATLQYGPGDIDLAHAVGERVPLAEVAHCARVYALLILRCCGLVS